MDHAVRGAGLVLANAFGEMDEIGRAKLAAFAAQSEHLCNFDLMPVEGRVYFTRKTT